MGERHPMKEVDASFTGIGGLTPTSEFTKKNERAKLNITSFWTRIDGLTSSLVKLFVLSLILQFLMLAAPYYTQLVVDNVLVSFDSVTCCVSTRVWFSDAGIHYYRCVS